MTRSRGSSRLSLEGHSARAQQDAGDQRINAFGVGGEIRGSIRAFVAETGAGGRPGALGLGSHKPSMWRGSSGRTAYRRRNWCGGGRGVVVAEQRLKGSCPWVCAYNGTEDGVRDRLPWRSPLGCGSTRKIRRP